MQCSQPLGVKTAVVMVTTTGRCTSAHRGMLTCRAMGSVYGFGVKLAQP